MANKDDTGNTIIDAAYVSTEQPHNGLTLECQLGT